MNAVTMSAIIVTLFLGGPAGPTFFGPDWIWGPLWFLPSSSCSCSCSSGSGPRCPGSATTSSWTSAGRSLIPLALGWLLLLAAINVARDEDWNLPLVVAIGFVALVAVATPS